VAVDCQLVSAVVAFGLPGITILGAVFGRCLLHKVGATVSADDFVLLATGGWFVPVLQWALAWGVGYALAVAFPGVNPFLGAVGFFSLYVVGPVVVWWLLIAWWVRVRHRAARFRLAVALAIAVVTAFPPYLGIVCLYKHVKEGAFVADCLCKLSTVGRALAPYQAGHQGRFPPMQGWMDQLKPYTEGAGVFYCQTQPEFPYHYCPPRQADPRPTPAIIICSHDYGHKDVVLLADGRLESRDWPR